MSKGVKTSGGVWATNVFNSGQHDNTLYRQHVEAKQDITADIDQPNTGLSIVKDGIQKYAEDSSLHGVQYFGGAKYNPVRRLIWFLMFVGSFTFLVINVSDAYQTLMRKPVQTKLSVEYTKTARFPTVTLCNFNKFRGIYVWTQPALMEILRYLYPLSEEDRKLQLNWEDPKYAPFINGSTYLDFAKIAGHQLRDSIYFARFKGMNLDIQKEFKQVVTDFGLCFQFNSNGTWNTSRSGTNNGLWIQMNAEHYMYFYGDSNSAGFKVALHNFDEEPLVNELGFAISPGQESFVSAQIKEIKSLPPPYEGGKCKNTTKENFVNHLAYYETYSMTGCRRECRTNYTVKRCGCKYIYDPGPARVCDAPEMGCYRQADGEYTQDESIEDDCDCFVPCHEIQYEHRLSTSMYPGNHIIYGLQAQYNVTKEIARENFLELRIFFEKLNYDLVEQVPSYDAMNFFTDLGGNLGLCIGASLLTAAELLEHIGITFFQVLQKFIGRKQTHPKKIQREGVF